MSHSVAPFVLRAHDLGNPHSWECRKPAVLRVPRATSSQDSAGRHRLECPSHNEKSWRQQGGRALRADHQASAQAARGSLRAGERALDPLAAERCRREGQGGQGAMRAKWRQIVQVLNYVTRAR